MQSLSVLGFLIEACSRLLRLHFIAVFGKLIWADCIKYVMLNIKNNVIDCALLLILTNGISLDQTLCSSLKWAQVKLS